MHLHLVPGEFPEGEAEGYVGLAVEGRSPKLHNRARNMKFIMGHLVHMLG